MKDYETGSTRIVSKFLYFPKTVGGKTKWLCRAVIKQSLVLRYKTSIPEMFGEVAPSPKKIWVNKSFI